MESRVDTVHMPKGVFGFLCNRLFVILNFPVFCLKAYKDFCKKMLRLTNWNKPFSVFFSLKSTILLQNFWHLSQLFPNQLGLWKT